MPPEPQNAINIDTLQSNEQPFTLPNTPRSEEVLDINKLLASFNQPNEAETRDTTLQDEILKSISKLGGQSARQQELETEAGLPQQQKDLQNVINQLTSLSAERSTIPLEIQEEFKGKLATRGGVQPIETSRLRQNAIKALQFSAIGSALQGNIALAQQNVDRALRAEFEPEETRLKILERAYDMNKDTLQRYDQKRAREFEVALQERNRIIAEQKSEKENILKATIDASSIGVPSEVTERASRAGSYQEAINILAPEIARNARDEKEAEDMINQLQAENIRSQINARNEDLRLRAIALAREQEIIEEEVAEVEEQNKQKLKAEAESALGIRSLINDLLGAGDEFSLGGFLSTGGVFGEKNVRSFATGFSSILPTLPGSKTRNFNLTHQQLKDTLTKDNLSALRGLGAMSERELALIEKSSTKLDLSLPEDEYIAELNKIAEALQPTFDKAISSGAVDPVDIAISYGLDDSDVMDLFNSGVLTNGSTKAFNINDLYESN